MKATTLAALVVMLLILLGVFWVGSEAAIAESSWIFGWLRIFLLGGLALLALIGAGYYVAKGQSKSDKFKRLFILLLSLGALLLLAALVAVGAAVGDGLGSKNGEPLFGLLLLPY